MGAMLANQILTGIFATISPDAGNVVWGAGGTALGAGIKILGDWISRRQSETKAKKETLRPLRAELLRNIQSIDSVLALKGAGPAAAERWDTKMGTDLAVCQKLAGILDSKPFEHVMIVYQELSRAPETVADSANSGNLPGIRERLQDLYNELGRFS